MNNEALINFIFRSKFDSSSFIKEDVENKLDEFINTSLDSEVYNKENINLMMYLIEQKILNFKDIHKEKTGDYKELKILIERLAGELSEKLKASKQLLNTALLSERKIASETYTSIIPLIKDYTSSATSATLQDDLILGLEKGEIKGEEYIALKGINLIGEDNTVLQINSMQFPYTLQVENQYKAYSTIRVEIPPIIRTGVLNIKFASALVISVLNQYNYEIKEKGVVKELSVPVDANSRYLKIRIYTQNKKAFQILSASYTDKIYTSNVVYETKRIEVGEDFTHLSIDTCDNYENQNVDLKYFIKINDDEYRRFRPINKFKTSLIDKHLESIITVDDYSNNKIIRLNNATLDNDVFKFSIEDLGISASKIRAFERKLGEDLYSINQYYKTDINTYTVYLYKNESFDLTFNAGQSITLNGEFLEFDKTTNLKIERGFNKLEIVKSLWKEPINLINSYVKEIKDSSLIIVNRITNEITEVPYIFNTIQASTNSIYLQLLAKNIDVYMNETLLKKKVDRLNYIEYFYKDNPEPIYLGSYLIQKTVKTVQIKVEMSSIDKKTCPFISRIMIRGV